MASVIMSGDRKIVFGSSTGCASDVKPSEPPIFESGILTVMELDRWDWKTSAPEFVPAQRTSRCSGTLPESCAQTFLDCAHLFHCRLPCVFLYALTAPMICMTLTLQSRDHHKLFVRIV